VFKSTKRTSIAIYKDKVSFSSANYDSGHAILTHCSYQVIDDHQQISEIVSKWVAEQELYGSECTLVLSPDDYELSLFDVSNIPNNEIYKAAQWQIRDILRIPSDNATLDVFTLPALSQTAKRKLAYIVASYQDRLNSYVALIRHAGLKLTCIDINEMAIRNLCAKQTVAGGVVISLDNHLSTLCLMRKGQLYLARSVDIDQLSIEIPRSLNYFQQYMHQNALEHAYFLPSQIDTEQLGHTLSTKVNLDFQTIDLNQSIQSSITLDKDTQMNCLSTIGGILRWQKETGNATIR